ncbi:type VII secretion protein EccB [Streptomyces mirabilis]|uniref:type VII secretion protein EccB n=1 Tax=Streptomyces mirabilis TaxID=68239 RepID=UPI00331AE063
MQSRRDQVQAHQFLVSRLTAGLLRADPDAAETPTRRTNRGILYGTAVGALISAGFLVFGLLSPGGDSSWRSGHALIIEKGTGTRYVYDGALRPVRNYASARLILGAGLTADSVSANSLSGAGHGAPVGITGAPDALPSAGALDNDPWEVCADTRGSGSGARVSHTTLAVDTDEAGIGVQAGEAVLVSGPDGTEFLVWHASRFRLAGGPGIADALGYGGARPLPVSAAFLDALTAGPDLGLPVIAHEGSAGPVLDDRDTRVGQLFTVRTPGSVQRYYVLLSDGLVPVTATQAALALADSTVQRKAYDGGVPRAVALSSHGLTSAVAPDGAAAGHALLQLGSALPSSPPTLLPVDDEQSVCVRLAGHRKTGVSVSVLLASSARLATDSVAPSAALAPACLPVDSVAVPPDGGSLVRVLGSAGTAVGDTVYLVTDLGVKYRLPSNTSVSDLGYDVTHAVGLPSTLLRMLPTGPDLSADAAKNGVSKALGEPSCGGAN